MAEKEAEVKDFLTLQDYSRESILRMVELAQRFKRRTVGGEERSALMGKHVALFFEKPSTRTRVSFEVAIRELGGNPIFLPSAETQVSRGETIADTARVLSRYVDGIVARVSSHGDLVEMARYAGVPVVNALSDRFHPVQILSDLFTILEAKGRLEGLRLAYVGDGNNVCHSLLLGCTKVGVDVRVACPEGYRPDAAVIRQAEENASASRCSLTVTDDPVEACRDADIVYTDVFVSMGREMEREDRLRAFLPRYQVTTGLLRVAADDVIFLHCLPAHRGEEVTDEVIDGPRSIVWTQAENRLYAQEALLATLIRRCT